jgi:16S rRNA (uracil1498-N3)-methyltransferase
MLHLFRVNDFSSPTISLTGEMGKHASSVLRLKAGEQVRFTDGRGKSALGTVREIISKSEVSFEISEVSHIEKPKPNLAVLQALPKGDRAVEAVELMVEVGVDDIYPWQAERSIAKWDKKKQEKSIAKWQQTSDTAAAQARRLWFPVVHELVTDLSTLNGQFDQVIVFHESANSPIPDEIAQNVLLVIGPEGSITDSERKQFSELGAIEARMGETILRSRHAGIAAAAAVLSKTVRWGK